MTSLRGHLGQNPEREDIARNELHSGEAAKCNRYFLRFVRVAGYSLNIRLLPTGDYSPILPQHGPQIKIGSLIIAVLQADPDMQITERREA
jgi:hypothetical protein